MGHNYTLPNGIILKPKAIAVYARDCRVEYLSPGHTPPENNGRQEVVEFSRKSRQRLAFVANNTSADFTSLLTLTYPGEYPCDGLLVKKQLRALLMRFARRYPGVRYLWFLEFQRRGAPHFHMLTETEPAKADKLWLSLAWYEIVASGDERHLAAGTNWQRVRDQDGARHYAVKYASKMRQKEVPAAYRNVGRFWGHSKGVKPVKVMRDIEVQDVDDLKHKCRSWDYQKALDQPLSVLYNASYVVALQQLLDKAED